MSATPIEAATRKFEGFLRTLTGDGYVIKAVEVKVVVGNPIEGFTVSLDSVEPVKGIPVRPNGDPVRVTRVISGSYNQFGDWCMFSRVNPRSSRVKYVSSEYDMRGLPDFDLVFTGTHWHRHGIYPVLSCATYLRKAGRCKWIDQAESADIEPNVVEC